FAIRNFVGANIITPDDELETFVREMADAPPMDKATQRKPPELEPQEDENDGSGSNGGDESPLKVQPPEPPKVGMPRQKAQPPVKTPQANAGSDRSGG
ncbi:MAG: hypothetical protein ABW007_27490, partial [Chitinophagaceae bacterium]